MLEWANIKQEDNFIDLGSGTGRVVFLAAILFHVQATGIEITGGLVKVAALMAHKLSLKKVTFCEKDFLEHDLSKNTLVYIAGTTFDLTLRNKLAEKAASLPYGAKVISLTTPLGGRYLRLIDSKTFCFSWGKTTAYLEERIMEN